MADDFIERYLEYTWETEPPRIFHRWSALTAVSAVLARSFHLQHGHFRVFPNLYTMLIGDAGTRKSTAVKLMKKSVAAAGYENFAADKTSKEKFLLDLEGVQTDEQGPQNGFSGAAAKRVYDAAMAENLWGGQDYSLADPRECFIAADEWNEFAGTGNLEFYTTLGNLWDWDDDGKPFTQRLKNSRSVAIFQPTISILGGNTPENFSKAFPPEIIGQGFLSRMILIHGERSGRRYTFPPIPHPDRTAAIKNEIAFIRSSHFGVASIEESGPAFRVLDKIYNEWVDIDDVRFRSYSNRRFTQLLKLCLVCAAARGDKHITADTVVRANTYLCAAEAHMPRALGEFGKAKNSDVTNKIMDLLVKTGKPLQIKVIWQHVHSDLEKIGQLGEMMQGLQIAEKVQFISGQGWLPKRAAQKAPDFVDFSILTEEERRGL